MKKLKVSKGTYLLTVLSLLGLCTGLSVEAAVYQEIIVDQEKREYRLFVPNTYAGDKRMPLVLNFHGTSTTPEMQDALSEFEALGEKENIIVVTPRAKFEVAPGGPVTWNVDELEGVDDVKFIRNLLAHVTENFNIDENRIFATGFSGGARMSSKLACELSENIAAIAPVAGIRHPEGCQPVRAVPIITFHGKRDPINHYVKRADSPAYWRMGIEEVVSRWVETNECKSVELTKLTSSLDFIKHSQCGDDAEIIFYRSNDSGHTWPGSPMAERMVQFSMGETEKSVNATQIIWQFFKAHPKAGNTI